VPRHRTFAPIPRSDVSAADRAAKRFFQKLPEGLPYVPRVVVTDKRKNYAAAKQEFLPGVKHRQSRYLNNWPRFRTSRRDGENDRCSGASRRVTPRDFSPPTVGSTTPSSFAATVSLLLDQAARNRAVQAWRDVAGIAGAA
jgi:hypothetical protein